MDLKILKTKLFFLRMLDIRMVRSCVGGSSFCLVAKVSVHAAIPSSWRIFVYKEETSSVTNRVLEGSVCRAWIL